MASNVLGDGLPAQQASSIDDTETHRGTTSDSLNGALCALHVTHNKTHADPLTLFNNPIYAGLFIRITPVEPSIDASEQERLNLMSHSENRLVAVDKKQLVLSSEYFRKMLDPQQGWKESSHSVIMLFGDNTSDTEAVLRWCHGGEAASLPFYPTALTTRETIETILDDIKIYELTEFMELTGSDEDPATNSVPIPTCLLDDEEREAYDEGPMQGLFTVATQRLNEVRSRKSERVREILSSSRFIQDEDGDLARAVVRQPLAYDETLEILKSFVGQWIVADKYRIPTLQELLENRFFDVNAHLSRHIFDLNMTDMALAIFDKLPISSAIRQAMSEESATWNSIDNAIGHRVYTLGEDYELARFGLQVDEFSAEVERMELGAEGDKALNEFVRRFSPQSPDWRSQLDELGNILQAYREDEDVLSTSNGESGSSEASHTAEQVATEPLSNEH